MDFSVGKFPMDNPSVNSIDSGYGLSVGNPSEIPMDCFPSVFLTDFVRQLIRPNTAAGL